MSELFPYVTELGKDVDIIQIALIATMAFWFLACNAVMVYFLLKYRRKGPNDKVSTIHGNHTLEVVWTVVPTILCLIIFWVGMEVWDDMRTMPEDALEVKVNARKWAWTFTYSDPKGEYIFDTPEGEVKLDGKVVPGELYVPVGQKVKFTMTSEDVIHSMYVPEFRVKEDIVPSLYTYLWFQADKPGVYNIFCTEYCGDDHSGMLGKVHVLDMATWERFVRDQPLDPRDKKRVGAELGEYLYVQNNCKGCHTADGSKSVGPTFKNLIGRSELMEGDSTLVVDENYIRESILVPKAKIVKGYPSNQMTSFEGILSDKDIDAIIDYMKTLSE